jgi:PAS domain-containing protein
MVLFHITRSRRLTREAEFRYRMLAEQVPAIVYMLELGEPNRMTYISPRIKTAFGFEPEAWLNQPAL